MRFRHAAHFKRRRLDKLDAIRARLRAPGQRIRIELRRVDRQRTVELATAA